MRFNIRQLTACSSCFCCCGCLVVALLLNNIEVRDAMSRKDFPCREDFQESVIFKRLMISSRKRYQAEALNNEDKPLTRLEHVSSNQETLYLE